MSVPVNQHTARPHQRAGGVVAHCPTCRWTSEPFTGFLAISAASFASAGHNMNAALAEKIARLPKAP